MLVMFRETRSPSGSTAPRIVMGTKRWSGGHNVAGAATAVVIGVFLVRVEHRRAVVEDVGDLVPVLILEGVDHEVGLAVTGREARAVGIRAADPLLAAAGTAVTEGARRAVGRGSACRPEVLEAVARSREHGRPAVALHERADQAIEVLTADFAHRRRRAVRGAPTWPLHFVARPLSGDARSWLTELPRWARA